jgi:hypothetical protein
MGRNDSGQADPITEAVEACREALADLTVEQKAEAVEAAGLGGAGGSQLPAAGATPVTGDLFSRRSHGEQGRHHPAGELPSGWKRSKAGSPYLTKAGLTGSVYRKGSGYRWRWKSWDGPAFVESPDAFLTESEAIDDAEKALPSARREISAMQASRSHDR